MGSKSKWIGLIILLAVIGAAAVYLLLGGGPQPEPTVLRGYVGGEKIGLLEDEAVQDILDRNYGLTLDYAKAGSLDMVTADHEGRNFLFPSSQTALEYYQQLYGAPDRSQIVFNTPIVLYTHRPILEAFQKEGLVTERDGVYYMDMAGLVAEIEAAPPGRTWGSRSSTAPWLSTLPTPCAPTPGICSRGCWPMCCAAGWRMRTAWRRCCPACRPSSRSWAIWRRPPPTSSTSSSRPAWGPSP